MRYERKWLQSCHTRQLFNKRRRPSEQPQNCYKRKKR
jgi:hypothetical protein